MLGQGSEEFSRLIRAFVASAVVLGQSGLALRYVENWTPAMDALILWMTIATLTRRQPGLLTPKRNHEHG